MSTEKEDDLTRKYRKMGMSWSISLSEEAAERLTQAAEELRQHG